MKAGDLQWRVVIQQLTGARDEYGQEIQTWSTVATLWAAIEPLDGRELMLAKQINAEATTRIRTRYYPDINPAMRIAWDGRYFNILSIADTQMNHRELVMLCRDFV